MKRCILFMLVAGILLSNNGLSLFALAEESKKISEESLLEEERDAKEKEVNTETENEGDKLKNKEESKTETEEDKTKDKEESKTEKENEEDKENDKEEVDFSDSSEDPIDSEPLDEIEYDSFSETRIRKPAKIASREVKLISKGKIGEDHPTEPGEVILFKEAKPVKGRVNTWEVTLRLEAMNEPTTTDIVMLLDRSSAMGRDLYSFTNSIGYYIRGMPEDKNIRLGLVSFGDYARIDQGLTSNYSYIADAMMRAQARGGAFLQDGLKKAGEMLEESDATIKDIIIISNGRSSYGYPLKNPEEYLRKLEQTVLASYDAKRSRIMGGDDLQYLNGYETIRDIPRGEFDYTSRSVGTGKATWHAFEFVGRDSDLNKMYNFDNSALAEASYLDCRISAICLLTYSGGYGPLPTMAEETGGEYQQGSNGGDVANWATYMIENIISEKVKSSLVDTLGKGFEITEENIKTSQGEAVFEDNTITWNLNLFEDPIAEDSEVYYAELKYVVEINEDILGVESQDGLYPTNEEATFKSNGIDEKFPVPMVEPVIGKVTKEVQNKDGQVIEKDEEFEINISGPGGFEKSYLINTIEGNKSFSFTDFRIPGEYTLEEVGDLNEYEVTYLVNGEEGNKFSLREDNGGKIDLKIINKEKCGKIVIRKELEENNLQETPSFEFKVTGPNGFEEIFTLPENDKWEKEIYDLEQGKYTVTELTDSYKTSVKIGDGEFEENKSAEVTIGNGKFEKNIHFKNEFEKSDFQIEKRSSKDDIKLEGAGFTLYSTNESWEEGEEIDSKMTDSNGLVKFENLTPGSYLLKETIIPEEHTLGAEFWKLEVDSEGNIKFSTNKDKEVMTEEIDGIPTYIIYNLTGVVLPATGDKGVDIFAIVGSSLAVVTLIKLYKKRRSHGKIK